MKTRKQWLNRLQALWLEKSVIWLSGVRRIGKTCLCQQVPNVRYLNCDLPSVQRQLEDPEFFLSQQSSERALVLDEVHRLADPSLLLKIAADEFPGLRVLATGSSTLDATRKFRDSLTDRKRSLRLPPVLWRECITCFTCDLDHRLLHGGFPERLLASVPKSGFYEDWIDGFYARDILELFGIRNRSGFLSLLQLVCLRNGGQLDVSDLAKKTGLSRPTVMSHLDAMEIAHAVIRIPPYHGGGHREIIRQPKIYAFDTGLVAYVQGWESIRESDRGVLWKNLVLDELLAVYPRRSVHYWRDKSRRELDFVLDRGGDKADAIEAKIRPDRFDSKSLIAFRELHPAGRNYIVSPVVDRPYRISRKGLNIVVCRPDQMNKNMF